MASTTTNYDLRKPDGGDAPDFAQVVADLADDTDAALAVIASDSLDTAIVFAIALGG